MGTKVNDLDLCLSRLRSCQVVNQCITFAIELAYRESNGHVTPEGQVVTPKAQYLKISWRCYLVIT